MRSHKKVLDYLTGLFKAWIGGTFLYFSFLDCAWFPFLIMKLILSDGHFQGLLLKPTTCILVNAICEHWTLVYDFIN